MAKVLPLFRGFVSAHAKYFDEQYSYKHRGTDPGQLAKIYPVFRDRIVLAGLGLVAALGGSVDLISMDNIWISRSYALPRAIARPQRA